MASKNKERRAAARLRGEESHARRDAGNAILMLWMSDAEGRVIYGDERMQAFWGPDLVGADLRDWSAAAHPDDAEEVAARLARALEPEGDLSLRARFRRGDGTYRFLRIEARPRRSVDGKLLGLLGASVDLTDVLEAERARREEEARYRAIVESQTEMVCRFRRDGTLVFVNSAYARSVGASVDELRGDSLWRVVPEDQRPHVEAMLSRLSPAEPEVRIENRFRAAEGERVALWINRALAFDPEGQYLEVQATGVDITDRKQAEDARLRLTAIVESSDDAIVSKDLDGVIVSWNKSAERIFGYAADEAVGKPITIIIPSDRHAEEDAILERIRAGRRVEPYETVRETKGGALVDVSLTISPVKDGSGRIVGASKIARDITERKRIENALRESEQRFRVMANAAPVLMWLCGPDKSATWFNEGWLAFTGRTLEQELGEGWVASVHADDREPLLAAIAAAYDQRGPLSMEYRLRRHDGEHRWVLGKAVPLSAEGELTGYVGSAVDITEQKAAEEAQHDLARMLEERVAREIAEREKTEQQLRQAQKMESIGRLTGGVAHDFNNLLQIIGGSVQLVSEHIPIGDPAQERLRAAKEAVARGARLASQLLAFGRRQPLAPKPIHVGRLLRGLDEMLRPALGEGVEIETIVAGGLWNALVDPSQLENAVLNLAINGADAMGGYGKLTIEVVNAFLDDAYAALHDIAPGQYVMIAVTDTGRGIPAEIMDRVFEPFFTTKPEGQGTGLGLSMVYGFARQSGGHVKIYSEVGQGTTVRLYLPRTREAGVEALDRPQAPAQRGHETVLLVEDDAAVRETVAAMLADLGYTVLKAKDAQSAYAVIESGAPIDLLFTDVVMPGPMRSVDLARKARERLPDVAVLFTSGYTENAVVHGGRLDEGVDLLSKPYSQEALARKVRQVLSRRGAASSTAVAGRAPGASGGDPVEGLSVLLVEDEVLIRMATVQMLNDLGCSVVEAVSVEGALAALEAQPFDALITDIRLPGGSGFDLAIEARQRFPDLRIVLASGAQLDPGEEKRAQLSDVVGLPKPYDKAALTAALRKTI